MKSTAMRLLLHLLLLWPVPGALAFLTPGNHDRFTRVSTNPSLGGAAAAPLYASLSDEERMKKIMEEEALKPENMRIAKEQLLNLKPSDVDAVLRDMDNMPAAQKQQMEKMGMNPEIMRQSLEMLKNNPEMARQMAQMMDTMTPEQLLERSRQAQERLATGPSIMDGEVTSKSKQKQVDDDDDEEEDDDEDEDVDIPAPDSGLLDAMFRVAELMSDPPTGGVTLQAFATLPPIAMLTGDDSDRDMSKKELNECWLDGSLGSTRVDRKGFERVWMEVQEYFSMEIMVKARERSLEGKEKRRGGSKSKATTVVPSSTPLVGADIPPQVLEQQVKSMSDNDLDAMLDQMKSMTPEQEARMRAMGANPEMMAKTASILKNNPLMKNAAKMMMKNMSPEQMKKMSEQTQKQMQNMTAEQYQEMMSKLDKEGFLK